MLLQVCPFFVAYFPVFFCHSDSFHFWSRTPIWQLPRLSPAKLYQFRPQSLAPNERANLLFERLSPLDKNLETKVGGKSNWLHE